MHSACQTQKISEIRHFSDDHAMVQLFNCKAARHPSPNRQEPAKALGKGLPPRHAERV
jgi:hypothetical protein